MNRIAVYRPAVITPFYGGGFLDNIIRNVQKMTDKNTYLKLIEEEKQRKQRKQGNGKKKTTRGGRKGGKRKTKK